MYMNKKIKAKLTQYNKFIENINEDTATYIRTFGIKLGNLGILDGHGADEKVLKARVKKINKALYDLRRRG